MEWTRILTIFTLTLFLGVYAHGFGGDGCSSGNCVDCHSLSKEQAMEALAPIGQLKVTGVEMSEIPGFWNVHVAKDNLRIPLFIDFSLRYVIQGKVLDVTSRDDIIYQNFVKLNPVDVSKIPLENSLVVGDPDAKHKIFVFDDPNCPYCGKLHEVMKGLVKDRPDIAFFIKVYAMKKNSYEKAMAILCENSMELLEKAFAGEELPPATCETTLVDEIIKLAQANHVSSTPTMIFPDGRVLKGYKDAEKIVELLNADKTVRAK